MAIANSHCIQYVQSIRRKTIKPLPVIIVAVKPFRFTRPLSTSYSKTTRYTFLFQKKKKNYLTRLHGIFFTMNRLPIHFLENLPRSVFSFLNSNNKRLGDTICYAFVLAYHTLQYSYFCRLHKHFYSRILHIVKCRPYRLCILSTY